MSKIPKILVVDDEETILELINFHLERDGYSTLTATEGKSALKLVHKYKPDAIILDLMLPGIDGFEICRRIRQEDNTVPILMLTAKQDEIDKVLGLEIGADDYITKPFSPRELLARIKAVLRRSQGISTQQERDNISIGNLVINPSKFQVLESGQELELTRKEFELLLVLASNPGQVFHREYLVEELWGYDYDGDTRTVDVHIRRLRAKLGNSNYIETVHGIGYRFREQTE